MDSVYDMGYRAYFGGEGYTENPFTPGLKDHDRWASGWRVGRQDHSDYGMDPEIVIDPYELGFIAFWSDHTRLMNPWSTDSLEGQDWLQGWTSALDLADEISEEASV